MLRQKLETCASVGEYNTENSQQFDQFKMSWNEYLFENYDFNGLLPDND